MKVLVTGAGGQLGYDVCRQLAEKKIPCYGAGRQDFSLTDSEQMARFFAEYRPEAVIHCGAYTAVDKAEDEPELCYAVNGRGTEELAKLCRQYGAKLLYISTDYVFAGEGEAFASPEDKKAPLNVYGRSKLAGEEAVQRILPQHFIVRISWVFGINGKNFIKTMLRLAETHDQLKVVADQYGSPTYTADLARLLIEMIQTEKYGVYHATNEGVCSWAELAAEVFRQEELPVEVVPVSSAEYPVKAVRPKNSRLSKKCLDEAGFARLPGWQDAVRRYLQEIHAQQAKG